MADGGFDKVINIKTGRENKFDHPNAWFVYPNEETGKTGYPLAAKYSENDGDTINRYKAFLTGKRFPIDVDTNFKESVERTLCIRRFNNKQYLPRRRIKQFEKEHVNFVWLESSRPHQSEYIYRPTAQEIKFHRFTQISDQYFQSENFRALPIDEQTQIRENSTQYYCLSAKGDSVGRRKSLQYLKDFRANSPAAAAKKTSSLSNSPDRAKSNRTDRAQSATNTPPPRGVDQAELNRQQIELEKRLSKEAKQRKTKAEASKAPPKKKNPTPPPSPKRAPKFLAPIAVPTANPTGPAPGLPIPIGPIVPIRPPAPAPAPVPAPGPAVPPAGPPAVPPPGPPGPPPPGAGGGIVPPVIMATPNLRDLPHFNPDNKDDVMAFLPKFKAWIGLMGIAVANIEPTFEMAMEGAAQRYYQETLTNMRKTTLVEWDAIYGALKQKFNKFGNTASAVQLAWLNTNPSKCKNFTAWIEEMRDIATILGKPPAEIFEMIKLRAPMATWALIQSAPDIDAAIKIMNEMDARDTSDQGKVETKAAHFMGMTDQPNLQNAAIADITQKLDTLTSFVYNNAAAKEQYGGRGDDRNNSRDRRDSRDRGRSENKGKDGQSRYRSSSRDRRDRSDNKGSYPRDRSDSRNRFDPKCEFCEKRGHTVMKCPAKEKLDQAMAQYQGGRRRGGGGYRNQAPPKKKYPKDNRSGDREPRKRYEDFNRCLEVFQTTTTDLINALGETSEEEELND